MGNWVPFLGIRGHDSSQVLLTSCALGSLVERRGLACREQVRPAVRRFVRPLHLWFESLSENMRWSHRLNYPSKYRRLTLQKLKVRINRNVKVKKGLSDLRRSTDQCSRRCQVTSSTTHACYPCVGGETGDPSSPRSACSLGHNKQPDIRHAHPTSFHSPLEPGSRAVNERRPLHWQGGQSAIS